MAYDEKLAERLRTALADHEGVREVSEVKMFGGLAFLVHGHMAIGVLKDDLFLRVGSDGLAAALARPHARPMDFTGRVSKHMVYVAPPGSKGAALRAWVKLACAHAASRPAKRR
jgi:TfoX/Sxy family transcriptional regulator of competence genes